MMIYPSWLVGWALVRGVDTHSAAGMPAAGNWVWEKSGSYFGVPLRNYAGWLLTTFLVYCGGGLIWRVTESQASKLSAGTRGVTVTFAALPVIVYTVHALPYVTAGRIHALHVVALFAMGLPGLLALIQTYLVKNAPDAAHA